jgi:uncharacterized membrane protein
MTRLKFPSPHTHKLPPVRDADALFRERLTPSQIAADRVAAVVGSWKFILIQSAVLAVWAALNVVTVVRHWDPYPFILMNLVLSLQAAYTAPVIMMSQNRQAARDRVDAHNDYATNIRAEKGIRVVLDHLVAQESALEAIHSLAEQSAANRRPRLTIEPQPED